MGGEIVISPPWQTAEAARFEEVDEPMEEGA
jgi:hypothetical protein